MNTENCIIRYEFSARYLFLYIAVHVLANWMYTFVNRKYIYILNCTTKFIFQRQMQHWYRVIWIECSQHHKTTIDHYCALSKMMQRQGKLTTLHGLDSLPSVQVVFIYR